MIPVKITTLNSKITIIITNLITIVTSETTNSITITLIIENSQ